VAAHNHPARGEVDLQAIGLQQSGGAASGASGERRNPARMRASSSCMLNGLVT
jgi:hypothetical protein